jgi:hypothetical protein
VIRYNNYHIRSTNIKRTFIPQKDIYIFFTKTQENLRSHWMHLSFVAYEQAQQSKVKEASIGEFIMVD